MNRGNSSFRVSLISPPLWGSLHGPALALPSLAGALTHRGIEVIQRDLNIETISSQDFLDLVCSRVEEEFRTLDALERIPHDRVEEYRHLQGLMSSLYLVLDDGNSIEDRYTFLSRVFEPLMTVSTDIRGLDDMIREDRRNFLRPFMAETLLPELLFDPPGLIGISLSCSGQLLGALTLAHLIRLHAPSLSIVFGGSLLCLLDAPMLRDILELPYVDYIIRYEGERSLPALVEVLLSGKSLDSVPNLVRIDDGALMATEVMDPLHPDECHPPCFDGLSDRGYAPPLKIPILQARGCYWGRCTFCDIHLYVGGKKKYIHCNPVSLTDRMIELSNRHGFDLFEIVTTAMSPAYAGRFSDELLKRGARIRWETRIKVERQFTRSILERMAKAGCEQISIGVESITGRVIRLMDKGDYDREEVERLLNDIRRAGVERTKIWLLPGFPTMSRTESDAQLDFLRDNAHLITIVNIFPFHVLPKTPICEEPSRFGIVLERGCERSMFGLYAIPYETTMGMSRIEGEAAARRCMQSWEAITQKDESTQNLPTDWFGLDYQLRGSFKVLPVSHGELLQNPPPEAGAGRTSRILVIPRLRRSYIISDSVDPILDLLSDGRGHSFDQLVSTTSQSFDIPDIEATMMTIEILTTLSECRLLDYDEANRERS
ncbi:B12-binding domain-containing radical SAM protein [Thermodesulfobacteriota bacterium]